MSIILTDITNQFVLPLWNQQALDVVDCFVSPSADIQTTFLVGQGPKALKDYVKQIFNAFSAFEFRIQEILTLDNQLIYKWNGNAIHSGPVLNVAPKGEKIGFSGIISMEMMEGIITSYHSFSDIPRVISTPPTTSIAKQYSEIFSDLFSFEKEMVITILKNITGRRLTNREVECLSLWMKGFSIKDTAKLLGDLSCRTVQTFRENIKRKLNVDTFQQLFSLIQNSGIMTILVD
ncbi:MAG TPA: ester cyclase [Gammaproteobacteria bacterium]|nr:ester cyclase [Gammaproteobacteria bacterium]